MDEHIGRENSGTSLPGFDNLLPDIDVSMSPGLDNTTFDFGNYSPDRIDSGNFSKFLFPSPNESLPSLIDSTTSANDPTSSHIPTNNSTVSDIDELGADTIIPSTSKSLALISSPAQDNFISNTNARPFSNAALANSRFIDSLKAKGAPPELFVSNKFKECHDTGQAMMPYDPKVAMEASKRAPGNQLVLMDSPDVEMLEEIDQKPAVGALEFSSWEQKEEADHKNIKPPDSIEDITDMQLAYIDLKVLMELMHKANYTEQQVIATKARRRKIKNRHSAKGSANKRRVQMTSISNVNKQLVQVVTGLKQKNDKLQGDNLQLQQDAVRAQQEAAKATEERKRYEAEVNRLTELVKFLSAEKLEKLNGKA